MKESEMKYPAIKPRRYTGKEKIVSCSGEKIATLNDFWSWAYSDVLGNTERGILAEYLVSKALDMAENSVCQPQQGGILPRPTDLPGPNRDLRRGGDHRSTV